MTFSCAPWRWTGPHINVVVVLAASLVGCVSIGPIRPVEGPRSSPSLVPGRVWFIGTAAPHGRM